MTELTTANSYIVRVYRVDPDDPRHLTGQVETLDGRGVRSPFTDLDELAALLNRGTAKEAKRKRAVSKQD